MTTKEKIIDSAVNLFAKNGYAETGMREIAANVGIKDDSIYNHFPSKREILGHLISLYMAKVDETAEHRLNALDGMECHTLDDILNQLFFSFEPDEHEFYTKTLKVILREQYRDKAAGDCVKYHIFYTSQMRIKAILDRLISLEVIDPLDTLLASKLLCCVLVSFSVESAHHIRIDDPIYCASEKMFDVLRYAFSNVIRLKSTAHSAAPRQTMA